MEKYRVIGKSERFDIASGADCGIVTPFDCQAQVQYFEAHANPFDKFIMSLPRKIRRQFLAHVKREATNPNRR